MCKVNKNKSNDQANSLFSAQPTNPVERLCRTIPKLLPNDT